MFRRTNKYLIAQYVISKESRDEVKIGINSKNLLRYGWPKENKGSLKSITAAYLIGLLMGKQIIKEKKEAPIFDFGMITPVHKTKPFAFLKGIIDSGVKMTHNGNIFPEEEKIRGKYLKKDFSEIFEKIKSNIEKQ